MKRKTLLVLIAAAILVLSVAYVYATNIDPNRSPLARIVTPPGGSIVLPSWLSEEFCGLAGQPIPHSMVLIMEEIAFHVPSSVDANQVEIMFECTTTECPGYYLFVDHQGNTHGAGYDGWFPLYGPRAPLWIWVSGDIFTPCDMCVSMSRAHWRVSGSDRQ